MTTEDRQVVLNALWRAVRTARRLPIMDAGTALDEIQAAIEAVYNSHGDVRAAEAYQAGRQEAEATIPAARSAAFRAGMIAVQKRSDFRDLAFIEDPEELRHTH